MKLEQCNKFNVTSEQFQLKLRSFFLNKNNITQYISGYFFQLLKIYKY